MIKPSVLKRRSDETVASTVTKPSLILGVRYDTCVMLASTMKVVGLCMILLVLVRTCSLYRIRYGLSLDLLPPSPGVRPKAKTIGNWHFFIADGMSPPLNGCSRVPIPDQHRAPRVTLARLNEFSYQGEQYIGIVLFNTVARVD